MESRWKKSRFTVTAVRYYVMWTTKYLRPVLTDDVKPALASLIRKRAGEIDVTVENLSVSSDRVAIVLASSPLNAPHYIVQQLKRATSLSLRMQYQTLRTRIPTLWNREYYLRSLDAETEEKEEDFIEGERRK